MDAKEVRTVEEEAKIDRQKEREREKEREGESGSGKLSRESGSGIVHHVVAAVRLPIFG